MRFLNRQHLYMGGSIFVCFMIAIGLFLWLRPNSTVLTPFKTKSYAIVYKGNVLPYTVKVKEGRLFVPYSFIQHKIDKTAYIDTVTKTFVVPTKSNQIALSAAVQPFMEEDAVDLSVIAVKEKEDWYISYASIKNLYPYEIHYNQQSKLAVLYPREKELEKTEVITSLSGGKQELRQEPHKTKPIVGYVQSSEKVDVIKKEEKWFFVQKETGEFGYIERKHVSQTWKETLSWNKEAPKKKSGMPKKEKINLVWEAVYGKNPDTETIPDLTGINVVVPTWFELSTTKGDIKSKGDSTYVEWAHKKGYAVWGVVTNAFKPALTHAVLSDKAKRTHMVRQLVAYAALYQLDGINIDFENAYNKDSQYFVDFMKELTPYLHEQGLKVSIDVAMPSSWNLFYNRKELASIVDYIAVMAYDEHWSTSPVAGSVASLPWVEKGIKETISDVPPEKVLLGIPLYTRVWKEVNQQTHNDTLSMKYTEDWIKRHEATVRYDMKAKQHYTESKEGNALLKVWIEDEFSIKNRIELVHQYKLAGIGSWERSFGSDSIWKIMHNTLQK